MNFIDKLKISNGSAHLLGLASDGGVHASINHLIETSKILDQHDIPVLLHLLTDGRDVAPKSAEIFLNLLIKNLPKTVKIASVSGRYFAMDRDSKWDRINKAYEVIVLGKGLSSKSAHEIIQKNYSLLINLRAKLTVNLKI